MYANENILNLPVLLFQHLMVADKSVIDTIGGAVLLSALLVSMW